MTDPNTKSATPPPAATSPKSRAPVFTRIIVSAMVVLLTLAAIAIAVPWAFYRYKHVVVGEAVIKGTITKTGSRIDGRIKSIEVEIGQQVVKDQVLLRLDDSHFQAGLEKTRAQLQSSISDLESEKLAIDQARRRLTLEIQRVKGNRSAAQGAVDAEKSNLERCEQQYSAISKLLTNGAAAKIDLINAAAARDRSVALIQAASGTLDAAEFSFEKAENELEGVRVRESRLGFFNSQIAGARAQVAAAESDLEATVIRAPEEGRVLERIVEVGGSAKVGEPMISLWIGRAWVEAWTDERDLNKFKIGSPVEISLDASPAHKLAGRVEAIGLASDKQLQPAPVPATLHAFVRQNAMVPVRISLEEDNARIQLGISAIVGITRGSSRLEAQGPSVAQHPRSTNSAFSVLNEK
jgi:membrane fusion protein (multidrug efflux system)